MRQAARAQLAPKLSVKPNSDFYIPLRYSVRPPRIVDHDAPRAVCLTPQNIRILGRESHGLIVRPGASE
jgi:hypothetical protein